MPFPESIEEQPGFQEMFEECFDPIKYRYNTVAASYDDLVVREYNNTFGDNTSTRSVYQCKKCYSLTFYPEGHVDWHLKSK